MVTSESPKLYHKDISLTNSVTSNEMGSILKYLPRKSPGSHGFTSESYKTSEGANADYLELF